MNDLPADLQIGIDSAVANVPELSVHSIEFQQNNYTWVIHFAFRINVGPNPFVKEMTQWYAVIAETYPFGELDLYPAEKEGISVTFPHQSININLPGKPWKNGKICVRTNYAVWGKAGYDQEPFTSAERLRWHIRRALLWIEKAAANRLVEYGDPYELPDTIANDVWIAFRETEQTFDFWIDKINQAGIVDLTQISRTQHFAVKSFRILNNNLNYEWGKEISKSSKSKSGIWVLLSDILVVRPWQTPITWGELFMAATVVGCDLRTLLHKMYCKCGSGSSFIMLGFPIPERYGEPNLRVHWQAISMPNFPPVKASYTLIIIMTLLLR